jgi:HK97 family phage major capsid protein
MNESQLKARKNAIDAEAKAIDAELSSAVASKSFKHLPAIEARIDQLAADRSELEQLENVAKSVRNHPLGMGMASAAGHGVVDTKAVKGNASPLAFSEQSLKGLHQAVMSNQSFSTKAFSTVDGLLPAQLDGSVLGIIHESRLLDKIPSISISAPSYEYIRHTGSTGAPTVVAEGFPKPDVVLETDQVIATVSKLAATFGLSRESMMDWSNFTSYAQTEMVRQIIDLENSELLNGTGLTGNILGLNLTVGALTHAVTTETGLDAIEIGIAALRTGASLAVADLLVLHPNTWSALRRTKDTQGRYLVNPDPTAADGQRIWDVDVLVTTTQAAGAGLLLDTTKFGRVLVREGINVATGTNNDDFSRNISRWVIEERLALAVERPTALLTLTGLPVV